MNSLYELAHNLSGGEIGVVKTYLNFLCPERDETFASKLFDYLLQKKECPSEKDSCIYLYGTAWEKEEPLRKLQYRLKTKILDALCIELNEEKKEKLDELDYAAFRVKKKSIQSRLLYFSNTKLVIARELIDDIIAECRKYELYGALAEHLDIKKWRYAFREGEKEFTKIVSKAEFYKECERAQAKANDYYYKLIFVSEKNAAGEQKVNAFLKKAIRELNLLAEKTKSDSVKYYLKFFELYSFMRGKNYKAMKPCGK
ncbi:MAG: hypothetical protein HY063_12380 [Bacteroidetes bacterium]|nr:hypothetical protein [Bacteroidota bacterium]